MNWKFLQSALIYVNWWVQITPQCFIKHDVADLSLSFKCIIIKLVLKVGWFEVCFKGYIPQMVCSWLSILHNKCSSLWHGRNFRNCLWTLPIFQLCIKALVNNSSKYSLRRTSYVWQLCVCFVNMFNIWFHVIILPCIH